MGEGGGCYNVPKSPLSSPVLRDHAFVMNYASGHLTKFYTENLLPPISIIKSLASLNYVQKIIAPPTTSQVLSQYFPILEILSLFSKHSID